MRPTILLVEDDASVRHVVALLLELDGHRVFAEEDVPSALEFARCHVGQIDLLVADFRLPGGNAPALVAGLAELGCRPPVLYLSGSPLPEDGLPGRATSYLSKPFVPAQLTAEVLRLLGR